MEFQKHFFSDLGETIYHGISAKGLPVYVIKKTGYAESYALFATHFGSINRQMTFRGETEETVLPDGIAHFLEHKMFEEPDGTDAFERFSKTGANANAYTNFDTTAYLFSCTDGFEENLRTLLDFVQTPHYTEQNVAKEQGIIGQEIRMYDDDPEWVAYFNCLQALYHQHPVRIDIAGTVESIAEITPELLYRCHESFYHPGNMALIVAGDVDPNRVGVIVDEMIRTDAKPAISETFPEEPQTVLSHEANAHLAVSLPLFQLGFKDMPETTPQGLLHQRLCAVLAMHLLTSESGKLHQDLYENGHIFAPLMAECMSHPSYFCVLIGGESEDPKLVRDRIIQAAGRLAEDPEFERDFQRVKKNAYGSFVKLFDHVDHVAGQQLRFFLDGVDMADYLPALNTITAQDIKDYLKTRFTADKSALSIVWPKED
ncbi:MAG: insulinase family protein [Clostridia bacterium]|nr:insulinase family protein [Clostridia bacterium]